MIRIATRRSQLALVQANWVKAQLEALEPGLRVELCEYVTKGDRVQSVALPLVGGKGLFTKEIEDALLAGEADVAVHSLKDLPSELPDGLILAAVPAREDPRDALVLPTVGTPVQALESHARLPHLPSGARVGSSSLRRSSQIRSLRPDLMVEVVRGNVDTRLRKLDEGQYDALILAAAGLRRLGLANRISSVISPEECTPAPGQGALGLEARMGDDRTRSLLSKLQDPGTAASVEAERAVMTAVGGGCSVPLGAWASPQYDQLNLLAVVASPDGTRLVRVHDCGPLSQARELGERVAAQLLADGAGEILKRHAAE